MVWFRAPPELHLPCPPSWQVSKRSAAAPPRKSKQKTTPESNGSDRHGLPRGVTELLRSGASLVSFSSFLLLGQAGKSTRHIFSTHQRNRKAMFYSLLRTTPPPPLPLP